MHISYLCHYFFPEPGAPSARLYELSRAWVHAGHTVTIITGMPNHPTGVVLPEYRGRLAARETLGGITVLRNWLYATPNDGLVRKTLSHLSFMVSVVMLGLPRMGETDVIIVSSPTFFSALAAWVISRARGVPFVFEVRDMWPAVFVDLGVITNSLIIRCLEFLEMFLYRRAARVVTVTESFRQILLQRGLPPHKVITVTNGADVDFFVPGPRDNKVREELGLRGKFIISYIGAHGISQGLETVLEAARLLRDAPDIVFLLVGEGAEKRALLALCTQHNLENVLMCPVQPKARVPAYYQASDICLVPLRDITLFKSFIPSKIFEIMACGIPLIGAVHGEAREILERSGAASLVGPEDAAELAGAIRWLYAHPDNRAQMGVAGRSFVCANYDRESLAKRYEILLEEVVA